MPTFNIIVVGTRRENFSWDLYLAHFLTNINRINIIEKIFTLFSILCLGFNKKQQYSIKKINEFWIFEWININLTSLTVSSTQSQGSLVIHASW